MGSGSRYETIAEIGTGGMASVFVGRVRGGDDLVALKRAHPHVKGDPKVAASMLREANLAARVRHPNVVNVLDVEEDEGDLVLVLDYVEGCTLRTLFHRLERAGEWRPREMLRIVLDVAAGLDAAHRMGLVHRDVSPSNVLVGSDGVARLADFGLAKAQFEGGGGERTQTGILKGKLAYMAPEYIMYQRIDAASDLFSFAVVTWESLAGSRLFKGNSDIETLALIADAHTVSLSSVRRELRPFDPIFARALAKLPEDRFRSVAQMAGELEHIGRGYDLVASRQEVAELVERVAEPELTERRSLLRVDGRTMHRASLARLVPEAEPSGDLPTQVHSARRLSLPPAAPSSYPPPPSRTSRPPPLSRPPPSHPPAPPVPSRSAPPPTARVRSHRNEQAEREANREHLALVGALMLLLLALVWLWSTMASDKARPGAAYEPPSGADAGVSPAVPVAPTSTTERGNRPRRPAP